MPGVSWRYTTGMQIVIAVCVLLFHPAPEPFATEQLITANEQAIEKAWLRHDAAVVDRFYADDFSGTTSRGRTIGKADILKAVEHNDESATEQAEVRVRVLGESAIYTALVTDHGTRESTHEPYTVRTRVMDIWVKRNNRWQMVASMETLVKE
jgi:ketosteroid isomerase-like protein